MAMEDQVLTVRTVGEGEVDERLKTGENLLQSNQKQKERLWLWLRHVRSCLLRLWSRPGVGLPW